MSITLPKPLHDFIDKFATLEGCRAEDWYVKWIRGDLEAFLEQLSNADLNMKSLITRNDLKEILELRNPSFVDRMLKI